LPILFSSPTEILNLIDRTLISKRSLFLNVQPLPSSLASVVNPPLLNLIKVAHGVNNFHFLKNNLNKLSIYVTDQFKEVNMRLLKHFAIALTPFLLYADGDLPVPLPEMPLVINVELPTPVSETIVPEMPPQIEVTQTEPMTPQTPEPSNPVPSTQMAPSVISPENPLMIKIEVSTLPAGHSVKVEVTPNSHNVEVAPSPKTQEATLMPSVGAAPAEPTSQPEEAANEPEMTPPAQEMASTSCTTPFNVMHVDVRHIESKGVGYNVGYTTLQGFGIYDGYGAAFMPFLDIRGHMFNNGKYAASAGIGERSYIPSINHLFGLYCYYDARQGEKGLFAQQVSPGLELLGKRMEYRVNGYFPVGPRRSHGYDSQFHKFDGNSLFMKFRKKYVLLGADAEVGAHVTQSTNHDVYFGIGPYYFTGDPLTAWGGKARFLWRYQDYVALEASYSYDHLFKNIVQGSVSFSYPFGPKVHRKRQDCKTGENLALSRAAFAPYRFEIPVVKRKTIKQKAINPATNAPFRALFVNNLSHSAGTFESPFSTLNAAQNASVPNDIIYVYPGDGTTNGMNSGIILKDGQFLFGSATFHPLKTKHGRIVIPPFSATPPSLTNAGSIVTLGNSCEVSGLYLIATQAASNAIDGSAGITNANINQNIVTGSVNYSAINVNGLGNFSIKRNILTAGASGIIGILAQIPDGDFASIKIIENSVTGFGSSILVTPMANPTTASSDVLIAGNLCQGFSARGISYTTGGPSTFVRIFNNAIFNTVASGGFNDGIFVDLNDFGNDGEVVIRGNLIVATTPNNTARGIDAKMDGATNAFSRMIIDGNSITTGSTTGSMGISMSVVTTNTICASITNNNIIAPTGILGINLNAMAGTINVDNFTNNQTSPFQVNMMGNVNFIPPGSCGQ
jgi:hypothetical protein